ncbi:HET-domain-containing protein [Xylariaceae sp. FL1272]|nr:HET-domain-containing protein [Xylariaceae sp. FL1272]
MRLLNTSTFKLETFIGGRVPPYAILSHTWGEDEVLFEDIQRAPKKQWKTKTGAKKVLKAVQQAAKGGFGYIWIDNCCIDKSSSAELSEAINSMFRWYEQSKVCYVYLSDVPPSASKSRRKLRTQTWKSILPFMRSRWFKRGWTAPQKVVFFGMTWQTLGTRTSMAEWIHAVTRIDLDILYDSGSKSLTDQACRGCSQWPCPKHKWFTVPSKSVRLKSYSVHTKMVWARNRKTTRPEDRAYSLMGIFGINMPLLYGEEGAHAFLRLQEEIIKTTRDQSILLAPQPHQWP